MLHSRTISPNWKAEIKVNKRPPMHSHIPWREDKHVYVCLWTSFHIVWHNPLFIFWLCWRTLASLPHFTLHRLAPKAPPLSYDYQGNDHWAARDDDSTIVSSESSYYLRIISDWITMFGDYSASLTKTNRKARISTCVLATLRGIAWFIVCVWRNEMRSTHVFAL